MGASKKYDWTEADKFHHLVSSRVVGKSKAIEKEFSPLRTTTTIIRRDVFKILWKGYTCQARRSDEGDWTFSLYFGEYPSALAVGRPGDNYDSANVEAVKQDAKEWMAQQVKVQERPTKITYMRNSAEREWN